MENLPPGWQSPIVAQPGEIQAGVDPSRLLPGWLDLNRVRLECQRNLLLNGVPRFTPIQVTTDGVINDGHHAIRAAAEEGRLVSVFVISQSLPFTHISILDLPVSWDYELPARSD